MSAFSRPVLLLLCGLMLLTDCIALLNTLVPLWLNYQHVSVWQVGVVGSSYFTGNLLGTLLAGRLILSQGFNRGYYLAAVLFALATQGLMFSTDVTSWLVWRFVAGVGCALIWVVVESALLCSGSATHRGQLLAAYMVAYYLGSVVGQIYVGLLPTAVASVVPWMVMLIVFAVLPLLCTRLPRLTQPEHPVHVGKMLRKRSARLGINGCVISGVIL